MRHLGEFGPRARVALPVAVAALLALPAAAIAGWGSPEPVSGVQRAFVAPGGPGYAVGFVATQPTRLRFAQRPLDGTLGAPLEFPGLFGIASSTPSFTFDASGNALMADEGAGTIAYRQAIDGATAGPWSMGAGQHPARVSVAPTGEAMIGLTSGAAGTIRIAFRPAGKDSVVNLSSGAVEDISAAGSLIGLLLQADGGAIVVWQEGDTLYQRVRQAGQPTFDPPTAIPSPVADNRKFSVRFAGDPSGWAAISWLGSSGGNARDLAVASVRAPNSGFPAPAVVGTGGTSVNVTPAVTSTGDGLVVWRNDITGGVCPTDSATMGARYHGGTWSPQESLGASGRTSIPADAGGVVGAGNDVAVDMIEIKDTGVACAYGDDERSLKVHHFRSTGSGLSDQGMSELQPAQLGPQGQTVYPTMNDLAIESGGKMLAWYQSGTGQQYLRAFDGVTPGAAGNGSPGGGGGGGPAPPAPTPAGKPGAILPIMPTHFVLLQPINPLNPRFELLCLPEDDPGDCRFKVAFYVRLSGKAINPDGTVKTSASRKPVLVARATASAKSGKRVKAKVQFTKVGKALLRQGKKLKLLADVTVTKNGRSATSRVTTTMKARPRRH